MYLFKVYIVLNAARGYHSAVTIYCHVQEQTIWLQLSSPFSKKSPCLCRDLKHWTPTTIQNIHTLYTARLWPLVIIIKIISNQILFDLRIRQFDEGCSKERIVRPCWIEYVHHVILFVPNNAAAVQGRCGTQTLFLQIFIQTTIYFLLYRIFYPFNFQTEILSTLSNWLLSYLA